MTKRQPSTHALAAKAIRAELKALGIKARVRSDVFAGGDAVRIEANDVHPDIFDEMKKIVNKYQYGSFDGMTDSYDYDNCNDKLPQVKYVTYCNNLSEVLRQKAYEYLLVNDPGFPDNMPEKYVDAGRIVHPFWNDSVYVLVNRFLRKPKYFEKVA